MGDLPPQTWFASAIVAESRHLAHEFCCPTDSGLHADTSVSAGIGTADYPRNPAYL
jgi:hypothetical protein